MIKLPFALFEYMFTFIALYDIISGTIFLLQKGLQHGTQSIRIL